MIKEKVLNEKLPEDKYQGGTDAKSVSIPKPKKLVGGSDVYQKLGVPYWHCKIKGGRDEFMHLYTEDLTEQDLLFDSKTGTARKFVTENQKIFRDLVCDALAHKPKEGYIWIPVFEPSSHESDGVQFVKGKKVLFGYHPEKWEEIFKKYSPENESQMASIHTFYLQLLRWLKDGIATLEQLTVDSKDMGHYKNSKNAKNDFEQTGEREFGGLYALIGNSSKFVKDPNAKTGFSYVGGMCWDESNSFPAATLIRVNTLFCLDYYNVGLLELKK